MNYATFFSFSVMLIVNTLSYSQIKPSSQVFTLKNIQSIAGSDQYILDTLSCDLNGDNFKDFIIVLDLKVNNKENAQHEFPLPIKILKGSKEGFKLWMNNQKLVEDLDANCPADGYQRIVSKLSYFTVESTICLDNFYVTQFATFKYNKEGDNILLYKFGIKKINRENPEQKFADITYTSKDFGKIRFQDFNIKEFVPNKFKH